MPPISGKVPLIRDPPRIRNSVTGSKDFRKNIHVADYYEWVDENWNQDHPRNQFEMFQDALEVGRRNEEHKREIGAVLREQLNGIYRKKIYSKAVIQDYQRVKAAMEKVHSIPELAIYFKYSRGSLMVRKLTEQHMETVSRRYRMKNNGK